MKIFGFEIGKRSTVVDPTNTNVVVDRVDRNLQRVLSLYAGGNLSDFDLNKSELIASVYACVSQYTDNISRCSLSVVQNTDAGKTQLVDHPLYNQLKYRPSKTYSYKNWMAYVVSLLLLRGNCFVAINKGSLDILDPTYIDGASIEDGYIFYTSGQGNQKFRFDELLHFKLTLSKNGIFGCSCVSSLRNEIQENYKSSKTLDAIYSNGMNSRVFLQPKPDLKTTTEVQDEQIARFKDKNIGYNNQSSVDVVPFAYELKSITIPREDIAILETVKASAQMIASVFKVPYHLISADVNLPFSNYENLRTYFVQNVLNNVFDVLVQELNDKLIPVVDKNNGIAIEFDKSGLDATDLTTVTNSVVALSNNGIITKNEARVKMGYDKIPHENLDLNFTQVQNVAIQKTDYEQHPLLIPNSAKKIDNNYKVEQEDDTQTQSD